MPLYGRAMRSTSGFRMHLATPTTYTGLSVAGRRPVIYYHPRPEATHACIAAVSIWEKVSYQHLLILYK